MIYGTIAGIDKPASRLAQGTVMVSTGDMDYTCTILDAAFELGITVYDTAHIYGGGDNERAVGRWINERGIHDQVIILGKGAHHNEDRNRVTPFDITADLYDSLARFKTGYIDLYLLHRDDPEMPVEPIVETLNMHLQAGLIRAFGGSNWSYERVRAANKYAEEAGLVGFAASSPHFSLAEQYNEPWGGCLTLTGEKNREARDWYEKTQMPIFSWSSVAQGFFSGKLTRENFQNPEEHGMELTAHCFAGEENFKRLDRAQELAQKKGVSPVQLALAWVLHQPMNMFPLVGSWRPEEAKANAEALDISLTPEEVKWLNLED